MKAKLFSILLLSAVIGFTACVDESYDISNVSTNDIAIGDESSEFDIPIATISLSTADIDGTKSKADVDLSLSEMLELANAFLPSGESITISKLISTTESEAYIEELVIDLITELQKSKDKREDLAKQLLVYDEKIDDDVYTELGINDISDYDSYITLAEAIYNAVYDVEQSDIDDIVDAVCEYISGDIIDALKEYVEVEEVTTIEEVVIPSEITDVLDGCTLSPIITIDNELPFDLDIDKLEISYNGSTIDLNDPNAEFELSEIIDILSSGNAEVAFGVSLNSYSATSTTGTELLKIKIAVKLKGAIKL